MDRKAALRNGIIGALVVLALLCLLGVGYVAAPDSPQQSMQETGEGFTVASSVWWDRDYKFRHEIVNISDEGIAIHVNGTGGFCGKQILVPGSLTGNLTMYYNNCSDFVLVANNSIEADYDVTDNETLNSEIYDEQLMLYYPFDINRSAEDRTGQYSGTTPGANAKWVTGKYGKAYNFSNTYINSGYRIHNFSESTELAVSLWFNTSATSNNHAFFGYSNNYGMYERDTIWGYLDITYKNIKFYLNPWVNYGEAIEINNIELNDGLWHHIIFMRNNSQMNIFVDGVKQPRNVTWENPITLFSQNKDWWVGAVNNWNGNYMFFNGTIDEFRVYNRSLTDAEIEQLYNNSLDKYLNLGEKETTAVNESAALDIIDAAIFHSTAWLGNTYSNAPVVISDSNGTLWNATFDRIHVEGNHTWLFNYYEQDESLLNWPDFAPSVYVWEGQLLLDIEVYDEVLAQIDDYDT